MGDEFCFKGLYYAAKWSSGFGSDAENSMLRKFRNYKTREEGIAWGSLDRSKLERSRYDYYIIYL